MQRGLKIANCQNVICGTCMDNMDEVPCPEVTRMHRFFVYKKISRSQLQVLIPHIMSCLNANWAKTT